MASFASILTRWYAAHPRPMPWRGNPDPYAVWISEIMLQQTQVETVRGYFERFLKSFPTVQSLAAASEESVLKAWQGLGYYTRARNLRRAARTVAATGFPRTAAGWQELPGIGPYTAAAIASISFGEPAPVVDGNVCRVLARLNMLGQDFRSAPARKGLAALLAPEIARASSPGDFNQALMDLGETVCRPQRPACAECPLARRCRARAARRQSDFPARPAKKELPLRRFTAFLTNDAEGRILLTKRTASRLLQGLWELPNVEARIPAERLAAAFRSLTGAEASAFKCLGTLEHTFSHFHQSMTVYRTSPLPAFKPIPTLRFAVPSALPLTTLARRAIKIYHSPCSVR